jgi:cytochrome c peroxidase
MTAALHRRSVRLALVGALVLAAGLTLWLVARGGEPPVNPHANTLTRAEGARILKAVDAAAAGQSNAELVAEGRRLFRSSEVARSGESCQTCHVDAATNPSLGTITHDGSNGDPITGPRDAPALWDVKDTAPYRWGGDLATLELMAADTVTNHFEGGATMSEAALAERVAALVAYMRSLDPPQTDFDNGTMTAAARRGEELFQGKGGCIGCHGGPAFTDNGFHPLQRNPPAGDPGQPGSNPAAFNTPGLRDVANTAPYMHDGRLATLEEVLRFYNQDSTVAPLGLTATEQADIIEYLKALSR